MRNGYSRREIAPNQYPDNDWYRVNLKRNFDYIVLGNGNSAADYQVDRKSMFYMGRPHQTFSWDLMVLFHFHSILKPGGVVVFPITAKSFSAVQEVADKRPYYLTFQPYVFTKSFWTIFYLKVCRRLPALLLRPYWWRDMIGFSVLSYVPSVEEGLSNLRDFCDVRNYVPLFVLQTEEDAIVADVLQQYGFKWTYYKDFQSILGV